MSDPRRQAGAASRSKQVVIVTDGESLETGASDPACLGPSPAGASCAPAVAAAARRLHNHGWHVTVIAVGQQDALKLELHRQLTYPLDGGRYDATSHRWTTQHTAMASTLFNPGVLEMGLMSTIFHAFPSSVLRLCRVCAVPPEARRARCVAFFFNADWCYDW